MGKFLKKILVLSMFGGAMVSQAEELPLVAVTQIVEHPSLDAIYQGVLDKLNEEGFLMGRRCALNMKSRKGIYRLPHKLRKNLLEKIQR